MRGEKSVPFVSSTLILGSPPHAGGKDLDLVLDNDKAGITPACAGKSPPPGAYFSTA